MRSTREYRNRGLACSYNGIFKNTISRLTFRKRMKTLSSRNTNEAQQDNQNKTQPKSKLTLFSLVIYVLQEAKTTNET